MPGRVAAVLVGVLVALTSIGCGPPVELPSHEAHRQPVAPTVPIPSEADAPATTTAAQVPPVHPAVASPPVRARIAPTPTHAVVGADPADPATWDALARCESGGNWSSRTGTYRGGLQFLPSTWRSVGGSGDPADATRDEQIARGRILLARDGWGAWPACSRRLGYR